jgi:serine protease inhibitor
MFNNFNNTNLNKNERSKPLDQKDNILFDAQRHGLNIERRIFERDGFFNVDTKNVDTANYYKSKGSEHSDKEYGEITGDRFYASELEQGMPMRDFLVNEKQLLDKKESQNQYLDFDLYSKNQNIKNVSYFDPHGNNTGTNEMFSQINEPETEKKHKPYSMSEFTYTLNGNSILLYNGIKNSLSKVSKIVISPFSIMLSLFVLYLGAHGETHDELKQFLNLPDKNIVSELAKKIRIFIEKSGFISQHNMIYLPVYNQAFYSTVSDLSVIDELDINNINYERNRINSLVRKLTKGIISNVISDKCLSSNSRIVCVNTTIIKPKLKNPFYKNNTTKELFNGNHSRLIHMMSEKNIPCLYSENSKNRLLELDLYNEFMMGFIMSKSNCIPNIDYSELMSYWKNLQETKIRNIKIPKFKYQCRYKADSLLKKLGVINMFINGKFPNMTPISSGLNVTDIIHHSVIIFEEQGILYGTKQQSFVTDTSNIDFIVNKPFIFYIRHYPTNTLILLGLFV